MSGTSDRVVETLTRLHRYIDSRPSREEATPPQVSIAISRLAGSGGADVARAVGNRLGWPVYDNELLTRIAEEKGLHTRLLEHLDEHCASWLEEMVSTFATHDVSREGAYLRHLLELLASLSAAGHCVIVGRGGAQVMPVDVTLRVRMVASRDHRVAAIEKRFNFTHLEAERWVDRTDQDRTRFVKHHFHKEPSDALSYDLVLNSDRMGPEECADIIVHAVRALEARVRRKHEAKAAVAS